MILFFDPNSSPSLDTMRAFFVTLPFNLSVSINSFKYYYEIEISPVIFMNGLNFETTIAKTKQITSTTVINGIEMSQV